MPSQRVAIFLATGLLGAVLVAGATGWLVGHWGRMPPVPRAETTAVNEPTAVLDASPILRPPQSPPPAVYIARPLRVLFLARPGFESAAARRALTREWLTLTVVGFPLDDTLGPDEREALDLDACAYDVIILGNVSARQVKAIDSALPAKIRDQVVTQGVGLLMTGGHATFLGTPGYPDAGGWRGTPEIEDILPVRIDLPSPAPQDVLADDTARYQFLTTAEHQDHYLARLGATAEASADRWSRLNDLPNRTRFTGLSTVGPAKPGASVFAVASKRVRTAPAPVRTDEAARMPPVLVGHRIGVGGRVLVLAAEDTFLWQKLGLPRSRDGVELHARFWRSLVLWLAHRESDAAAAVAGVAGAPVR